MTTPTISSVAELGPRLISLPELVTWTGIPQSTLYSLMSEGRGPRSVKLGRQLRFQPADIHSWVDELAGQREGARA